MLAQSRTPGGAPGAPLTDVAAGRRDDVEERPVLCRSCGHVLASSKDAIEVGGSHVHTRLNPANVVFRFGCYGRAPGCAVSGVPSAEHVWFAGCLWQLAHCGKCRAHVGWAFSGAESFFGLVLDRLA